MFMKGAKMLDFDEEANIDLTPLIDVIFMLLIFFIMTTTFSKPVLDIVLPSSEQAEDNKKSSDELIISIKENGKIYYQEKELTKEELIVVLDSDTTALLNLYVDEKAPFQSFVKIVDIAKDKRGGYFVISTDSSK